MICLACGQPVRSASHLHLKRCSGITVAEYRARYPGTPLRDADVIARTTHHGAANGRYRGRSDRSCEQCGTRLSRRTRGRRCAVCLVRAGTANAFHGRRHSDETRARMSSAAKHRDPSSYRGGHGDPARLSAARRLWWAGVAPEARVALLDRFIVAGQRHNKRNRGTRIETIVRAWLTEWRVAFEQNVQVGRYNIDFLLDGGRAIECYGDFWHCNPELYQPAWYNGSLHCTAEAKWRRDDTRLHALQRLGLATLVLWERAIRYRPAEATGRLHEFLENPRASPG